MARRPMTDIIVRTIEKRAAFDLGALSRPSGPEVLHSHGDLWGLQRELPFEDTFKAVDDQLIILHLDGPVTVHRRVRKGESSRLIPPGGLFMMAIM
jgi:AraC family transcriptional regulator